MANDAKSLWGKMDRAARAKQFMPFDALQGFICGLYAGNYDISHIFIDNLSKIAHSKDLERTGAFLDWLDGFCTPLNIKATITISADPESATETMRKYL